MKMTEPKLEERAEQPYMGIRAEVPHTKFPEIIPQYLDELFAWLEARGVTPTGAPVMRYHVINMEGNMDVELGVPVASAVPAEGRIASAMLPAGRYASLVYTGVANGIPGNAALLEWGEKQGLVWDTYASDRGDGFGCRYETFLTGPIDDPDPANWDTEVAIRLADQS